MPQLTLLLYVLYITTVKGLKEVSSEINKMFFQSCLDCAEQGITNMVFFKRERNHSLNSMNLNARRYSYVHMKPLHSMFPYVNEVTLRGQNHP